MQLKHKWIGAIALAALTLVVSPAFAAHGSGGHGGGGRSGGGGGTRGAAVRGGGGGGGARAAAPSRGVAVARVGPGVAGSRVYGGYGYRSYGYGYGGFYRPYYAFRPRLSLGFGLWAGYPVAYPYYYGSPYAYPYPYPDPYSYAYPSYSYPAPSYGYPPQAPPSGYPSQAPSNYPPSGYPSQAPSNYPPSNYPPSNYPPSDYPPAGTVGVQPGAEASGGVSFQIDPTTAVVYVDGSAVGTVASFGPTSQPLALAPGRHHIEVRAPGYRTMAFDTDTVAGQVIPYQGTMQRQ
jgi:hypothetical protein